MHACTICAICTLPVSLYDDPAAGLCGDALAGLDEYPRARTVSADEALGARVPADLYWNEPFGPVRWRRA
jgi:hypothetical protein